VSYMLDALKRRAASLKEDPIFFNIIIILFAISFLTRIFFIFKYREIDYEADSYMHFLGSQAWIHSPFKNFDYLINWWYKPLFTFISGIVLKITIEDIIVIKLLNTIIWIGVLYLIYLIAKEHKLSKEIVFFSIFFTSFSFLAFRSSISSLTEPLFTLLIIAAYYFLLRGQFILSSLLISASFLCRMEGIIFMIIWGINFLIDKKYKFLIILPVFPLFWDILGFLRTGDVLYVIYDKHPLMLTSIYGRGDLFYYIIALFKYETIIFLFFVISLFLYRSRFIFIKMCILSLLVFNIIIWKYGLLGSAGLMRYLLPIIPFMSLLGSASFVESTKSKKYISSVNLKFILYFIIVLCQIIFTMTLIGGNSWGYGEFESPYVVNEEIINASIFIKSLDLNKTLIAEDPAIIYFSGRILGISAAQWFDYISGAQLFSPFSNESNTFYLAYDDWNRNDIAYKELDYYLKNSNFKLLKNFSSSVYVFEGRIPS
jgi:hypothetical protein